MLSDYDVGTAIAVKDIETAKQFYSQKLGLKTETEYPGGVLYGSGQSKFFIYVSEFAGTNKATYAGWDVQDIEAVVNDLKSKGVEFDHFPDMEGVTLEGDIHVMGSLKTAWFKDPDGNILALNSGM